MKTFEGNITGPRVYVNGRALNNPTSGVQRYTEELLKRIHTDYGVLKPRLDISLGMRGLLWEQLMLPCKVGSQLLWSPANSGPLAVAFQLLTVHDVAPIDHPEWVDSTYARWFRTFVITLIRRVRHVVTVSPFSRERIAIRANISLDRISVIPGAVDVRRFHPHSAQSERSRYRRRELPKHYVLALNSWEERKNLRRTLHAWLEALPYLPRDLWFVVAGGPRNGTSSFVGTDYSRRILFLGRVEEDALSSLYAGATAFVYVSLYEGFGLPILESMASGVPVITSHGSAMRDIAKDSAVLVDPLRVDLIAHGICKVIRSPSIQESLRIRGLCRVQDFSWDRSASALTNLIESIRSDAMKINHDDRGRQNEYIAEY